MRIRLVEYSLFLSLILFGSNYAQLDKYRTPYFYGDYSISIWQTEDGLPQNSILGMAQSPDGYLWCGTQQGIIKFDGISFAKVTDSSKKSLVNGEVFSLCAEKDNSMWAIARQQQILRIKNNSFEKMDILPAQFQRQIYTLHCTHTHGMIITAGNAIFLYKNEKIKQLHVIGSTKLQKFRFAFEQDGALLFTDNSGKLFRWNGDLVQRDATISNVSEFIHFARNFRMNGIVLLTSLGIYKQVNSNNYSFIPVFTGYKTPDIRGMVEDQKGNIWIATLNHGIFIVKGSKVTHIGRKEGLSSDFASSILVDNENNIWVGSYAGGLNKISHRHISGISAVEGLTNEFVFTIAETENGDLWTGSYGGGVFNIAGKKITNYTTKDGLGSNIVRSVLVDKYKRVWAACYDGGLFRLEGKRFINICSKNGIDEKLIHAMVQTADGIIWAGGGNGIYKISGDVMQKITVPEALRSSFVRGMSTGKNGELWIAYDYAGLALYKNNSFTLFGEKDGLKDKALRSLYIDEDGLLWITSGSGLTLMRNRKFFTFSDVPELNQLIYQIVEDANKDYWMPSNQGIFRISRTALLAFADGKRNDLPIALFNKSDGMLSSECNGGNQPAGIMLRNGKIAFPTLKGIAFIDYQELKPKTDFPQFQFSSVFGDQVEYGIVEPELAQGTSRVVINFAAPTFKDPQRIKFRYKLNNIDQNYQTFSNSRSITFTHLPAGNYELHLYIGNSDGEWESTPRVLRFSIKPYFYQTLLFWLIIAFCVFAIAIMLYYRRISKLKLQEKTLRLLVEQRTESLNQANTKLEKSLSDTMAAKTELQETNEQLKQANALKTQLLDMAAHDLRNPLNAIKGFSQILHEDFKKSEEEDKLLEHINSASSHMLMLINDLLETSHIESGKLTITFQEIDFNYTVKKILHHNRFLAQKKGQNIICSMPDAITIFSDERRVEEILDNLLSNAIKYSPFSTEIQLNTTMQGEMAVVEIKDQGPGLTPEDMQRVFGKFEKLSARPTDGEASTGLGLAIVKDLITLLHGEVWVESTKGKGSSFFVSFPLQKF